MGLTGVVDSEDTMNSVWRSTSRMVSPGAGVNPRARGICGKNPEVWGRLPNLQISQISVTPPVDSLPGEIQSRGRENMPPAGASDP